MLKDIIRVNYGDSFLSESYNLTMIKNRVVWDKSLEDEENDHLVGDEDNHVDNIMCVD